MTLHTNKELFSELIEFTSEHLKMRPLYIEKDYWVTYILKRLSQHEDSDKVIFKGGTSLSKAHKLIHRFSEDVDLAVITDGLNGNEIRNLIRGIEKSLMDENFKEVQTPITSKGSRFRKTTHNYPKLGGGDFGHANENIILEINSFAEPTPFSKVSISSYICDFLQESATDVISEYQLESFEINVLDITRTLCEKISAVARASYESDKDYTELKAKIRHLYDIHFLLQSKSIKTFIDTLAFSILMQAVREDDKSQFGDTDWVQVKLHQCKIFKEPVEVIGSLKNYYSSQFKDLVYSENLPEIDDIANSIQKISTILRIKGL